MLREDKVLDLGHEEHEDNEDGEVLDPAPLDDLPEAGCVHDILFRIIESKHMIVNSDTIIKY